MNQISGRAYLLIAVVIFATASSVTQKLTDLGASHPIDGRNPISFCNVLFVGNLCAFLVLLAIYRQQLNKIAFRQLSSQNWLGLVGVSILSGALAPALTFLALEQTSVNNVILIGRIESIITLALSVLFLKQRVNNWVIVGSVVSFFGVALTIFLQPPSENVMQMAGFQVGVGELMIVAAALASAVANLISQVALEQVSLGLFNLVKIVISTIVFLVVALQLFGSHHFIDAFSPLLWKWMLLYGAVIVVGGQLCWYAGLKRTNAGEIAIASSFYPIAGVIAAYLIVGEAPTIAQYIGGLVILMGITLSGVGVAQQTKKVTTISQVMSAQQEIARETKIGFRGI